jgi:hypothetical protein
MPVRDMRITAARWAPRRSRGMVGGMKKHLLSLTVVALLAFVATPGAAQAEPCKNGRSIGAGQGIKSFYLYACRAPAASGIYRAYAQFISGPNSTRATKCQIWIRPIGMHAEYFDCTPMLRVGRYRTYLFSYYATTRTQACYRLRYGTGTWTRSFCVTSG